MTRPMLRDIETVRATRQRHGWILCHRPSLIWSQRQLNRRCSCSALC